MFLRICLTIYFYYMCLKNYSAVGFKESEGILAGRNQVNTFF